METILIIAKCYLMNGESSNSYAKTAKYLFHSPYPNKMNRLWRFFLFVPRGFEGRERTSRGLVRAATGLRMKRREYCGVIRQAAIMGNESPPYISPRNLFTNTTHFNVDFTTPYVLYC